MGFSWRGFLYRIGLAPLSELQQSEARGDMLWDDLREAQVRLAQMERAFSFQGMAFSRRYEALEKTVIEGAHMRTPAPIIFPVDKAPAL